jgi:NADH:ubiquinone oxidoreductase subunit F (NADH-binding)
VVRFLAEESAGQCGPCVYGLASIADALEEISDGTAEPGTHLWVSKWADDVLGRGACGHPDGAVSFAASALHAFRDAIARHESSEACGAHSTGSWTLPLPEYVEAG